MSRILVVVLLMLLVMGCATKEQQAQKLFDQGRYEEIVQNYPNLPVAKTALDMVRQRAVADSLSRARLAEADSLARVQKAEAEAALRAQALADSNDTYFESVKDVQKNLDRIRMLETDYVIVNSGRGDAWLEENYRKLSTELSDVLFKWDKAAKPSTQMGLSALVDSCLKRYGDHIGMCFGVLMMERLGISYSPERTDDLAMYQKFRKRMDHRVQTAFASK